MDFKQTIALNPLQIHTMLKQGNSIVIDDVFLLVRISDSPDYKALKYPFLTDCFIAAFCLEGSVDCTVNLRTYTLLPGSLLIITPGSIMHITPLDAGEKLKFTILASSASFISDTGIDTGHILSEAISVLDDPCIHIAEKEIGLLHKYIDLCYDIANENPPFLKGCIAGLASSVFYQMAGFLAEMKKKEDMRPAEKGNRKNLILKEFIMLALEHHAKEHLVGFYADRLCLTPKYLSKIIRQASGRSVPDWLADFIILDAKNMLRHSDMNIKEISTALNFPSQSFFFRFFKQHTGQTPSQYRDE